MRPQYHYPFIWSVDFLTLNYRITMAVKLRLQRHGRKKRPFYHIVATDSRNRRDGKFIERIGMYNPITNPATVDIDRDKALKWLANGAQPTDTVRNILSATGVMYKKHLLRGVSKGAFSQEEADRLFQKWIDAKAKEETTRFKMTDWSVKSSKKHAVEPTHETATKAVEPIAEEVIEEPVSISEPVEETSIVEDDTTEDVYDPNDEV